MRVTAFPLMYCINTFKVSGGVGRLWGWITDPNQPLDSYSITLNGTPWVENQSFDERSDVRNRLFPSIEHTAQSGLRVEHPLGVVPVTGPAFEVTIVVKYQGAVQGAVTTTMRDLTRESERLPMPSEELCFHVGQGGTPQDKLYTGWRIYQDLKRGVEPYRPLAEMDHILDWGCGYGRIARFLTEDVPPAHLYGCDIDAENVAWAQTNIPGPTFVTIPTMPPTAYADGFFDLIFGISIFTHLDEPTQFAWLAELARISTPGGLVAVTVLHTSNVNKAAQHAVNERGFYDERSPQSAIFAPYGGADYFRNTFHSRDYIERNWSRYFDLLEYREFGMNSHQTLIIMRSKRAMA